MRHLRRIMGVRGVESGLDATLRRHRGVFAVVAAGGLLLGVLACDDSDTVPPADSTISLSANPAQVIIENNVQVLPVTLIATVRNSIGVPLPGQDVRFTTTNGVLTPPPSTPIETDSIGNATAILTAASQGPQVTATAGKATVSLTLTAGSAAVCFITLTPSDPQTITDCSDEFDFTVLAEDCDSLPVDGVRIFLEFNNASSNANAVTGNFNPSNASTDTDGTFTTTLTLNQTTCNDNCIDKDCGTTIRAKDQSGIVFSPDVVLVDGIQ